MARLNGAKGYSANGFAHNAHCRQSSITPKGSRAALTWTGEQALAGRYRLQNQRPRPRTFGSRSLRAPRRRSRVPALRSRGLIKGNGDRLTVTDTGIEALGSWEALPTGPALIDYWRSRLGKAERLILEALTRSYPDALSKDEVAARAGYEANGGGFNNALGKLRTLELVQGRGELRASDSLFGAR
jgi:hypothetical protein